MKDDWKTPVQIAASSPSYEAHRDNSYYKKKRDCFTIDMTGKNSHTPARYASTELERCIKTEKTGGNKEIKSTPK